jgi:hypothetical protein
MEQDKMSGNPWRKSRGPAIPWMWFFVGLIAALVIQQIFRG